MRCRGYRHRWLAFGLTELTMAYATGHISGFHVNLAMTVGLVAGGQPQLPKRPSAKLMNRNVSSWQILLKKSVSGRAWTAMKLALLKSGLR